MDAINAGKDEQTNLPPQVDMPESVFNFHNGDLGKLKRIVQRQQLKTRVKFLKQVIRIHQPLIQAMKITQKAFQDGVKEGLLQAIKAEEEAQKTKAQATSLEGQGVPLARGSGVSTHIPADQPFADLPAASPELKAALKP